MSDKEMNRPGFEQFLVNVNKFIEEEAAKKNKERSYIRLFRPYNTNKINIMGSFEKAIEKESDAPRFTVSSKNSFGMIAKEQFSNYCFLHSEHRRVFDDFDAFSAYVSENHAHFVLDDEEVGNVISKLTEFKDDETGLRVLKDILKAGNGDERKSVFKTTLQKALYARCLMVAYYSCGLTLYGDAKQTEDLKNVLAGLDPALSLGIEHIEENELKDRKGFKKLVIKGVPSKKAFEGLNDPKIPVYRIREKNNRLFLSSNKNDRPLSYYFDSELKFIIDKDNRNKVLDILKEDKQTVVHETPDGFIVKYFPCKDTKEDIDKLGLSFTYDAGKGEVSIIKDGGISFSNIYDFLYERLNHYKNSAGALYSGVIPRLTKVEYREPSMDNATVEGLFLHLGRTSFFSMKSMGRAVAVSHPFMNNEFDFGAYKGSVISITDALDEYEILIQDEYYEKIKKLDNDYAPRESRTYNKKIREDTEILNNYLDYSLAQHNINISGNLITEDGVCLYTLRGGDIEDSGDFYPSVNGGSEIYDKDVDFYRNSVEEDIPSIRYSTEHIYFGQELTREAIAELGLIDDSHVWDFYGLTCMGQKQAQKKHRMCFHFNVIGERRCMDKFEHIAEQKKKSAENFESKALYGYRFETHPNRWHKAGSFIINLLLPALIDNKDTIVWLSVFIISFFIYKNASGNGIEDILSLMFVIASAVMILYRVYNHMVLRKHEKMVNMIINDANILDVRTICANICKKLNIKDQIHMDNVLRLLTLMRLSDFFTDRGDR
ncbi:MAG: hypothetical protein K6F86_03525 [Lachnospiraceae bacterium]|nr:hypothetical protein [Lachnospiraceae bacterium]